MCLTLEHVSVSIKQRDILRDVSLHFNSGLHYVIGSNGSGKTSLLRAIMGLIQYDGGIFFDKKSITEISSKALAHRIAWLPQHPDWPAHLTVKDYVLLGRFPHLPWLGNYTQKDLKKVNTILRKLSLESFTHQPLGTLSGGERQQISLARALAQDTPVLLLDEPAQALDPANKAIFYQRIAKIAESKTVICTTHDIEYVCSSPAHISALKNGKLLWQKQGPFERDDLMESVFLS
jgi:iron complex transport system ATP-binding protein